MYSVSIIIGQIILKQTILNLIFFNRLAITFESFYKYKGVKRIIFVTLCTKLRKQNNDTENRQKSYLFLMHTNYIFIHILLFYKAQYFNTYEVPKLIYCTPLLTLSYHALMYQITPKYAIGYHVGYKYFQRRLNFIIFFADLFRNFDLINLQEE